MRSIKSPNLELLRYHLYSEMWNFMIGLFSIHTVSTYSKCSKTCYSIFVFNVIFISISIKSSGQLYCWGKPEHPEAIPPICHKSMTNFITSGCIDGNRTHLFQNSKNTVRPTHLKIAYCTFKMCFLNICVCRLIHLLYTDYITNASHISVVLPFYHHINTYIQSRMSIKIYTNYILQDFYQVSPVVWISITMSHVISSHDRRPDTKSFTSTRYM
jgi:hypothetical protein